MEIALTSTLAPMPMGWLSEEVTRDNSWVIQLNAQEISGFKLALTHAKQLNKPLLSMSPEDYPLPDRAKAVLQRAIQMTQSKWGFCLIKGFPVFEWSEADTRLAYWGMGMHMGVARPQNKASDILNDVRSVVDQSNYYGKGGRGYNTNASLDFHIDFGDVVTLLCRRTAKSGGQSLITSTKAIYQEIIRTHPELKETLHEPFYFSWQGASGLEDHEYNKCTLAGFKNAHFAFRSNLKNIIAAQRDFPDVPRLTVNQLKLLDLLEILYRDPKFCYSMQLEAGDLQFVNNYAVIHSRTAFEDFDSEDLKRHLLRLWLAIPGCQPLPDEWVEPYKNTAPNAVRGGLRGNNMPDEFLRFEAKMAKFHDMNNEYYERHPR